MTQPEHNALTIRRAVNGLQVLAQRIADKAASLAPTDAEQYIATKVSVITDALAEIDEPFATSTASWLTDEIRRQARDRRTNAA